MKNNTPCIKFYYLTSNTKVSFSFLPRHVGEQEAKVQIGMSSTSSRTSLLLITGAEYLHETLQVCFITGLDADIPNFLGHGTLVMGLGKGRAFRLKALQQRQRQPKILLSK